LIYPDDEFEEDSKENMSCLAGENFNLIVKKVDQLGIKMKQVCTVIENHTHSILQKILRSYSIPPDDKVLVTTCFHHVMCSSCHSKCKESNKS
jgi:hypothetical protein